APHGSESSGVKLGLGIGSEDVGTGDTSKTSAGSKALTAKQYDTLVTAFDATNASTYNSNKNAACATSGNTNNVCNCAVKAGSAFDGTLNSHKICGTGEGSKDDVTRKTNCRSGAPAAASNKNVAALGLGIGSEDVLSDSGTEKDSAKALTAKQWDTLVKAFEAENVSTASSDNGDQACNSGSGDKNCKSAVKAGSAFDGTPNSHKIKQDVAGTMRWRRMVPWLLMWGAATTAAMVQLSHRRS
ncbi:MAG: hypothetical protein ACTJLL_01800, partial [Anaplasma sp.]